MTHNSISQAFYSDFVFHEDKHLISVSNCKYSCRKIVLRKFKVFTGSGDDANANTELDDIGNVYDIQRSSSTTPIIE